MKITHDAKTMVSSGKRSGETTRTRQEETETRDSNEATGTTTDPRSRSISRTPPRRRSPRRHDRDRERRRDRDRDEREPREEKKEKREKKEKKPAAPAVPAQPMITVWVNDRLGTKQPIPCLAIDPIKDFKVMVAMKIVRKPHEILLKRQGERPFKDQLTLQDYGVSNNVQLDLEVDTGD
ncbi:uncharacterized protein A1O5_13475 [Cladophialophora psammophila CBS 110553]|uniref:Ubiquitin-like modifier HUB1 n=1 Tax=Cladophialophora psammophila CBS 110553 TaxID=1182543 RepID=W9VCT0_9EURO|nr:uncharacterized protein A1O5_13475 [Cladophialophora psammophila CBS 110553]EXJ53288.1 hypothetical protein A1O5_13475 [Cladophialophora psammophila CBS 110553]